MDRIFIAPSRYIQGPGILKRTAKYVSILGSRIFAVGGKTALSIFAESASHSLAANSLSVHSELLTGECSRSTAADLSQKARHYGAELVMGIGGGKAIDTAKAVSHETALPLVIIPTTASNDAACTSLCVQYTDSHLFDRFLIVKRPPDVVLVDSQIIAEAPTRHFVAGMGDALATWFEAHTCTTSGAKNIHDGIATMAALNLARLCFDTLMEFGLSAKLAVDQNAVSPAVEMVIEA